MSKRQQWSANKVFLRPVIAGQDRLVFSHDPSQTPLGTWLYREILYLKSCGIAVLPTQNAFVP